MSERYPILNALPPDDAAAIEAQSDAGIPLTTEQAAALGIRGDGIILLPVDGSLTKAQIRTAFPNAEAVLRDIKREWLKHYYAKKEQERDRASI